MGLSHLALPLFLLAVHEFHPFIIYYDYMSPAGTEAEPAGCWHGPTSGIGLLDPGLSSGLDDDETGLLPHGWVEMRPGILGAVTYFNPHKCNISPCHAWVPEMLFRDSVWCLQSNSILILLPSDRDRG